LPKLIEPTTLAPEEAYAEPGAVQLTDPLPPALRLPDWRTAALTNVCPPKDIEQTPVRAALALPEFVRLTRQFSGVPEHDTVPAETLAVLVNVPVNPNMYPEIAAAAMSVTATRMTVASTGEIPFLVVFLLYDSIS
jgi:hypothetical protein